MKAGTTNGRSNSATAEQNPMLRTKLWDNPCPFSFRINYLALCYNTALYDWIRDSFGLQRPDYVCLFSLGLSPGGTARDISHTSGFPKNTLSRAIKRLEDLKLIYRSGEGTSGARSQALYLSETGQHLFDQTMPIFRQQEQRMLAGLDEAEQQILSGLMSKVVMNTGDWAGELPDTTTFPNAIDSDILTNSENL